jgi:hypothetical protein
MPPETINQNPGHFPPDLTDETHPQVRVTIEVSGLKEFWEFPFMTSALQSALAAIEAVHMELKTRQQMAQQLERELGDGEIDPDYPSGRNEL